MNLIIHYMTNFSKPNPKDCWAIVLAMLFGSHSVGGINM